MKLAAFALLTLSFFPAYARNKLTISFMEKGQLGISESQCSEIESKLGQLFYVNVDGFTDESGNAISPLYLQMVKDLGIGGVLPKPHVERHTVDLLQKTYRKLQDSTELPLMIGIDHHYIEPSTPLGLGGSFGFLSKNYMLSSECLRETSYLDAFFHRSIGLNHALGPTIEQNANSLFNDGTRDANMVYSQARSTLRSFDELGVVTTIKHFPYTPQSFDLHDKSDDTKLSKAEVNKALAIFRELSREADFAMTTHLFNSVIDANDMATLSSEWLKLLREGAGFDGIIMTDALLMIEDYAESMKSMSSRWPNEEPIKVTNDNAIFVARSLLAGHDMVLLEGRSDQTRKTFNDVLYMACQKTGTGEALRTRILESYERIKKYKLERATQLRQSVTISKDLIAEAETVRKMPCSKERTDKFEKFRGRVMALGLPDIRRTSQNEATIGSSKDAAKE